jgi:hypothetical protein
VESVPIETVHLSDKQAQRSHFEPSQMVEGGELVRRKSGTGLGYGSFLREIRRRHES